MLPLRQIAELELSAASGLAWLGSHLYVVADDELFLDAYCAEDGRRAARIALPERAPLPEDPAARKRLKPDLESLAHLPDGSLLALGSGSTERRRTAYVFGPAPAGGAIPGAPRACDCAPLFDHLKQRFADLNVEGATAAGDVLRLLQRGNGKRSENAVIDLDLGRTLEHLDHEEPLGPELIVAVRPVVLGALDGVPLGFTDAAALGVGSRRIAFAAAAEDTDDPYLDGRCPGSAIGVLDEAGALEWTEALPGSFKVEGLALGGGGRALLVADPDDRSRRAPLLELASLPAGLRPR